MSAKSHRKNVHQKGHSIDVTARSKDLSEVPQQRACYRCGKTNHLSSACRFRNAVCNFCKIKGHLESVCRKKAWQHSTSLVCHIDAAPEILHAVEDDETSSPKLNVSLKIGSHPISFELDTATKGNFISVDNWKLVGKPCLHKPTLKFQSASLHRMPIK